jgi:large subunit ribosomal protein L31e
MAEEKIFTIPLREAYDKPRTKRAKIAVNIVKDFLIKHMKSKNIRIGKSINENIWSRSIQKPPRRVRVHAVKEEDIIYSELLGIDIKTPSKEEVKKKEEKKKEKKEKIKEERKERKKKTIQEEMEEETKGKPKELPGETKDQKSPKKRNQKKRNN